MKVQILNPYSLHESSKAPKKDKQRPNLSLVSDTIKTQGKKINFTNKPTLTLFNLKTKNQGKKRQSIKSQIKQKELLAEWLIRGDAKKAEWR